METGNRVAGNREPESKASGDCSIHTSCTHCIHDSNTGSWLYYDSVTCVTSFIIVYITI